MILFLLPLAGLGAVFATGAGGPTVMSLAGVVGVIYTLAVTVVFTTPGHDLPGGGVQLRRHGASAARSRRRLDPGLPSTPAEARGGFGPTAWAGPKPRSRHTDWTARRS